MELILNILKYVELVRMVFLMIFLCRMSSYSRVTSYVPLSALLEKNLCKKRIEEVWLVTSVFKER